MRCCLALVVACACSSPSAGGLGTPVDAPLNGVGAFDPAVTAITIEIDYETGQEPFTGSIAGFGDTFDPAQANLDRLFAGTRTLTLPRTLAAMENIGAVADEEISLEDILTLAGAHRDAQDTDTTRTYYVVFVSGCYADTSGPNCNVLGLSLGSTIAMFKDVIESTNLPLAPNVVRYVEQATLIHELAHSFGLTDNGVPMVMAHKDADKGAHCNNPDCVMFWQNEGATDAAMFAQQKLLTSSTILFDTACLADVDALTGGP